MRVYKVLLFVLGMAIFSFAGCVRHAPTTQIVCTRPQLNEKAVLVTIAPVALNGGPSERFTGPVETAVQTWLRGRGARTVEVPPYDFHVFGRVSESGDAPLGVATVTLKMITAESEVVANGAGTAVYSGGARDGDHSDMQAVGRAARLAAEGLCMTREREYLYTAPRQPPETSPADPYAYGYVYGYMGAYPVYGLHHHGHGGHMHGGTLSLPLPLPLQVYRAIKGDSGGERHRHDGRRHHRGGRRLGGHRRR